MKKKEPEGSSIGEMMLAKTVLEEKNEALESKDRQIRELAGRVRQLSAEALAAEKRQAELLRDAQEQGARAVMQSVVSLLADWGEGESTLAARLLTVLREKHGLEVIDRIQGRIDPRLHRVLQVDRESAPGTEVLARGYRLGDRVLRPAFVRVSLAAEGPHPA